MIFARRALQRRLDELRETFDASTVDDFATRLNRPGKDRLAAMWEVVVLSSLAKLGSLDHELALESGKRPDIKFSSPEIEFTADVTCISDSGLDEQNPFNELMRLLSEAQTTLGLPSGGLDLRVHAKELKSRRGERRVLRLPTKNKLPDFVRNEIVPSLRSQIAEGATRLSVLVDNDDVGLQVTIDTAGSGFRTGGYSPYSFPTIKDQNPLFNALKQKVAQIRAAEGLKGIIVVDGDCAALSSDQLGSNAFTPRQIADDFLRQYSSIDFVLMIAAREVLSSVVPPSSVTSLYPILATRENDQTRRQLAAVFENMLANLPKPVNSAANGALRASEPGYDFGFHGGYRMSSNRITVSARELMEVLAGLRTFDHQGALDQSDRTDDRDKSKITQAFLREIALGRLPAQVTVIPTNEDENDQWIEFEFGQPDAAVSVFR